MKQCSSHFYTKTWLRLYGIRLEEALQ